MQATDAIGGVVHRIAPALEELADHFRNLPVVLHQQNQP